MLTDKRPVAAESGVVESVVRIVAARAKARASSKPELMGTYANSLSANLHDDNRTQSSNWVIEWMRLIAHYPESSPVFLVSEQTIGHSPPEPFAANTSLSCMMLLADPTDFGCLRRTDGRTVRFYQLFPLYEEERVLKERDGTRVLLERFERYGVSEVVQPDRINVGIARPNPGGAISAR